MPEPKFLTDNIPHEYILLPNIKHAFGPEGVGLKWSVVYYLKDTNHAVVDIDTDDYSLDQLFNDTEIDSMCVKGNTKGFHVWVEFPKGKPDAYRKNVVKCSNLCEMDFLGEKVFERVGKTWTGEEPSHFHPESIEKCFIMDNFASKNKTDNKTQESSGDKALLKQIMDLIDIKYCDNRDTWLKILYAMKRCGFTEKEAQEWSIKSIRYTESGFNSAWEHYFSEEITATEGTIRYYAQLSNPTEYYKMTAKPFPTHPMEKIIRNYFGNWRGTVASYLTTPCICIIKISGE